MRVKQSSSAKQNLAIAAAIAGVVLITVLLWNTGRMGANLPQASQAVSEINTPTVLEGLSLDNLLETKKYSIYDDDELTIYIAKSPVGNPKLIYSYSEKPEGRNLTDNFFVHIYVKDSTKLVGTSTFANVDFVQKPIAVPVNGDLQYVFQKDLVSGSYTDRVIPISDIAYINTGRYQSKEGRSLSLKNLMLDFEDSPFLSTGLQKLHITTSRKNYSKIKDKRNEALKVKLLTTADGDLVKGKISHDNGPARDAEFRLKGDWADHLIDERKWSFRFIMEGESTIKGMRKFSIQHPKTRNYLWEWLYNKAIKDEGIIGLRYDFADVSLTIEDDGKKEEIAIGIMAVEESFDKILIENNKKREGVIIAFDESLYWSDIKKMKELGIDEKNYSKSLRSFNNAPIRVFNENKVLSDPVLSKQFNIARNLLEGLRQGKLKISEVFDVERLSTFEALTNLFGGYHGLVWHNVRIYYNPITGKLEPMSYDSFSGSKLEKFRSYPFSQSDEEYQKLLRTKLKLVSSSSYINKFVRKYSDELQELERAMSSEFTFTIDKSILEYNSNFIKRSLNPSLQLTAGLVDYDKNAITLRINNLTNYPLSVSGLIHEDGRKLSTRQSAHEVDSSSVAIIRFELNTYFRNAFVSKKNKKGDFQYPKDIEKLRLAHIIPGIGVLKLNEINPYTVSENLEQSIVSYRDANIPNIEQFSFIIIKNDSILNFKSGDHSLGSDLIIPLGYRVEVEPGFSLDFKNNASIKSQATFISKGTLEKPIKFFSSDGTGQGIFITNAQEKSEVAYTQFDNLSNPQSDTWSVSGAVNFHESEVSITHSSFTNNRCEDALNIIRSKFTMSDVLFENTRSDSFDGDFVNGTLTRCTFINSGNDGIDVSGSVLVLDDIKVNNPSDKGISAGENSQISGKNIEITGGEIGVVSKDLSTVNLIDLRIINTRLGLSAFQKKSEYGVASIDISELVLQGVAVEHLIEVNSSLTIDNKAVETVSNNVIDQMYGKEYGKSSR